MEVVLPVDVVTNIQTLEKGDRKKKGCVIPSDISVCSIQFFSEVNTRLCLKCSMKFKNTKIQNEENNTKIITVSPTHKTTMIEPKSNEYIVIEHSKYIQNLQFASTPCSCSGHYKPISEHIETYYHVIHLQCDKCGEEVHFLTHLQMHFTLLAGQQEAKE